MIFQNHKHCQFVAWLIPLIMWTHAVLAETVTATITRALPNHQETQPLRGDCIQRIIWASDFVPGLPAGERSSQAK